MRVSLAFSKRNESCVSLGLPHSGPGSAAVLSCILGDGGTEAGELQI